MAQYFNGRFLVQPQASVFVDDSRLANLNPTAANTLAIVGDCSAGVPKQAVQITDPNQARRVFRSGNLLDAILLAFDPSSQTGGATRIYAVRVNPATQSRSKILDSATPVKASATVTIGGTAAGGQVYTATINGVAVTYTAQGGDTNAVIASGLQAAINNSTNVLVNDAINGVAATLNGLVITVIAKFAGIDGNSISLTSGATGTGTAVASSATLSGGTGNTLINLTSDDYGLYNNQIYFKLAAGSTKGTKVSFGLTTSGNIIGGQLDRDNVWRDIFTGFQYTGAGSASTLTITDSALTTTCTGAPGDNLSISFATFTTIQQVYDYISATGKYAITLAAASVADLASQGQFDPKSAVDCKTTGQTLTANVQAIVDVINSSDNIYASATRQANPASSTIPVVTNTYFFGGTNGTITNQDWTDGFTALQTVDVQIVVPVSDSSTIHAAAAAHCQYMKDNGRSPRVAVVGGALGEYTPSGAVPTTTIIARTTALNSSRVMLVSPGITYINVLGQLVNGSSAFTAAMVGGMLAAVSAGTPLTHKYLSNIQALEVNFTPSDLDTLLLSGVCPIQYVVNKGYRLVQSKTTWLGAPNFGKNEMSTVMAIDAVSRRVQDTLDDQLVGQKVDPTTLAQAVSITETVLKGCQTDGLIVGDINSPAFINISARTDGGDTIRVQWQMSPAIPANYILCTASAVPFSGSVSSVS
jgi:hypothetical protein